LSQNKRPGEETIDKENKLMEERKTEIAKERMGDNKFKIFI
jgi:hypothetical protein